MALPNRKNYQGEFKKLSEQLGPDVMAKAYPAIIEFMESVNSKKERDQQDTNIGIARLRAEGNNTYRQSRITAAETTKLDLYGKQMRDVVGQILTVVKSGSILGGGDSSITDLAASALGTIADFMGGGGEKSVKPKAKIVEESRYKFNEKTGRWHDSQNKNRMISNEQAKGLGLEEGKAAQPKPAEAPKTETRVLEEKPKIKAEAPKPEAKLAIPEAVEKPGVFSRATSFGAKVLNRVALPVMAAYACWQAYDQISQLNPADPDYKKNITKIIAKLVAEFGIVTVATMLGTIAAGVVSGPGAIVGFLAGLGAGVAAQYVLGDSIDAVVEALVDKLWPDASKDATPIKKSSSLGGVSEADLPSPNATPVSYEGGPSAAVSSIQQSSENKDSFFDARDIFFGAKKIVFDAGKISFGEEENVLSEGVSRIAGRSTGARGSQRSLGESGGMMPNLMPPREPPKTNEPTGGGGSGVMPNQPATGGAGGGFGGMGGVPTGAGVEMTGDSQRAMDFFTSKGWTKEQAAGIVGNLMIESNLKTNAVGDSGKAYGIAQWHPDRQANFARWKGKDIRESTFEEQLEFVNYELTQGTEQRAGTMIKSARDAAQAAQLVDKYYERSKGLHTSQRMNAAVALFNKSGQAVAEASQPPGVGAAINQKSMPAPQSNKTSAGNRIEQTQTNQQQSGASSSTRTKDVSAKFRIEETFSYPI